MSASEAIAGDAVPAQRLPLEFRGKGLEFFRIWIVNISLTLLTLGIYSAWARVRTKRYFYGNTYLDGHSFDYHASPWRILVGRIIAVLIFIAYNVTASFNFSYAFAWLGVFIMALPWLINSSLRFNARNTSYRNVRFNFNGNYGGAFAAHIAWPIAGAVTFGLLIPLARRARDYYHINYHTFGGKPFRTEYTPWKIYGAYVLGFVFAAAIVAGLFQAFDAYTQWLATSDGASTSATTTTTTTKPSDDPMAGMYVMLFFYGIFFIAALLWSAVGAFIDTLVFNLNIGNTRIDERHRLEARLSPLTVVWIKASNLVLVLATLGLLYPWAKVRLARYQTRRLALLAASDLSEYTSEFYGSQSAVGEQIGSFFDVDLGL